MPYKDPKMEAECQARYHADPEKKKKIRARVDAWRKQNPEKARAGYRRNRKAARDRQALAEAAAVRKSIESRNKTIAALKAHRGYEGEINVTGI